MNISAVKDQLKALGINSQFQNPQPGFGNPQPGFGNPQPGFGNPQPGFGNPQPGFGNPQPGSGNPQPGSGNPPPANGNPNNAGSGNPPPANGNPNNAGSAIQCYSGSVVKAKGVGKTGKPEDLSKETCSAGVTQCYKSGSSYRGASSYTHRCSLKTTAQKEGCESKSSLKTCYCTGTFATQLQPKESISSWR